MKLGSSRVRSRHAKLPCNREKGCLRIQKLTPPAHTFNLSPCAVSFYAHHTCIVLLCVDALLYHCIDSVTRTRQTHIPISRISTRPRLTPRHTCTRRAHTPAFHTLRSILQAPRGGIMRKSVEVGRRIGELSPGSRSPNSGTTFKIQEKEAASRAFDFHGDAGEELERVEGCKYRMERWYYKLDQWIAKRRSQTILICASMFICVIIMGALYFALAAPSHYEDGDGLDIDDNKTYPVARDYTDALWDTWGFMADPGTHASQRTPAQRIISLLIAFQGVCSRAMRLCAHIYACVTSVSLSVPVDVSRTCAPLGGPSLLSATLANSLSVHLSPFPFSPFIPPSFPLLAGPPTAPTARTAILPQVSSSLASSSDLSSTQVRTTSRH